MPIMLITFIYNYLNKLYMINILNFSFMLLCDNGHKIETLHRFVLKGVPKIKSIYNITVIIQASKFLWIANVDSVIKYNEALVSSHSIA